MPRNDGLIAAALTPMNADGSVNTSPIPSLVDRLIAEGIRGLYVCGSTGEGVSLTTEERKVVAAAYVEAVAGRVPVMVQVGHNSLYEARGLAKHAAEIEASAISATCPSYFKVGSLACLIDCMREVATAASELPFYYYHIPTLTGNQLSMPQFLQQAKESIDNLAGIKYTTPELHIFQQCQQVAEGKFEVFWGTDEMLLPALAMGARSAIGSTYNIAAPLYARICDAFESGDLEQARQFQGLAIEMIEIAVDYPFQSAVKAIMQMRGHADLGAARLPLGKLNAGQRKSLESRLRDIGYFDWAF